MKLDDYKTMVMEQCPWPGNIGDSCAETSRYAHLKLLLGDDIDDVNLNCFVTTRGYIRHPTAPDAWRERDFSSDQALPLFLAFSLFDAKQAQKMKYRMEDYKWRTGNGNLVSPLLYALLNESQFLLKLFVVIQALLFAFPTRWSDSKNQFESSIDSSCDYINYIHCTVKVPRHYQLVHLDFLKEKVRQYYHNEPNSEFLIELYDKVIDKFC